MVSDTWARPSAVKVGTSGSADERCLLVTASARSLPSLTWGTCEESAANTMGVWPGTAAATAGPLPLKGTCMRSSAKDSPEQLAGQVRCRARARGGIIVFAGIGSDQLDQLADGPGRNRGMHAQQVRRHGCEGDRLEILDGIIRDRRIQAGIDHEARADEQDRVPVRMGGGGLPPAHVTASAWNVLDVELSAGPLGQFLCHQPRHDVGGPATANGTITRTGRFGQLPGACAVAAVYQHTARAISVPMIECPRPRATILEATAVAWETVTRTIMASRPVRW